MDNRETRPGISLPPSVPELVRQMLETEIIDGSLVAGERVSEDELARRLGVSRTPIREAMRVLEGHGLIVRNRGKGTYVARRTTSAEARTVYELRAPLEGFLAERAAENISVSELTGLEQLTSAFRDVLPDHEGTDLGRIIDADSAFHWCIYNAARSELVSIVRSYWGRLMRELYMRAYLTESPTRFAEQHDEILVALRARDGAGARKAMEDHVRSGWEAVRVSFDHAEPERAS